MLSAMVPAKWRSSRPFVCAKSRHNRPQGRDPAAMSQHATGDELENPVTNAPPPSPISPQPALIQVDMENCCFSICRRSTMNFCQVRADIEYIRSEFCTSTCCSLDAFSDVYPTSQTPIVVALKDCVWAQFRHSMKTSGSAARVPGYGAITFGGSGLRLVTQNRQGKTVQSFFPQTGQTCPSATPERSWSQVTTRPTSSIVSIPGSRASPSRFPISTVLVASHLPTYPLPPCHQPVSEPPP